MLLEKLMGHVAIASLDAEEADKMRRQVLADNPGSSSNGRGRSSGSSSGSSSNGSSSGSSSNGSPGGSPTSSGESGGSHSPKELLLDLDLWTDTGFPTGVAVAVMACVKGEWLLLTHEVLLQVPYESMNGLLFRYLRLQKYPTCFDHEKQQQSSSKGVPAQKWRLL
jgi:hypothetical protein